MKKTLWQHKITSYLISIKEWTLETPERSLNQAYQAALLIRSLENKHFNGKKIPAESTNHGDAVIAYFNLELKKYLSLIRIRLGEFYTSSFLIKNFNSGFLTVVESTSPNAHQKFLTTQNPLHKTSDLEKLKFIDEVLASYKLNNDTLSINPQIIQDENNQDKIPEEVTPIVHKPSNIKKVSNLDETSIVPRSIISTFNRIRLDCSPSMEQELVKTFRQSRRKTQTSVKFIILLIIVPVITYNLSKNLIIEPVFHHLDLFQSPTFINSEMEEKALEEMQKFEQKLKFENLMSEEATISAELMETQMKEKVHEIVQDFRQESSNAIKNVFADLLSVGAFCWLLLISKREIVILKDFIDQIIYGLSDTAKAFLIILVTDMFVGFHSAHGWEVILEGVLHHFGLPENQNFIFLFIATVPVILDAIFKYWIFRYLSRMSPSAAATYRNMNE
ncbi:proton extrusion protein PcxA [Scytonema sp. NUACC21]